MFGFIVALLVIDAFILAIVILLQAGQGGGLAALGGSSGTESFFGGRHAVTWLTKASWIGGGVFLFLALVLSLISSNRSVGSSEVQELLRNQPSIETSPLPLDTGGVPTVSPPPQEDDQPETPPPPTP